MVKRPQGLNKAARAKKQRVISEVQVPEKYGSDRTQQITIELDHEVDPDDELGQLKALYDTYLANTRGAQHDEQQEEQTANHHQKLLYGIVHECDRLLRNATDQLPAIFHNIYSLSLLALSEFATLTKKNDNSYINTNNNNKEQEDTSGAFIEAAIERAGLGLESDSVSFDLYFTRSKARIALVDDEMKKCGDKSKAIRYQVGSTLIPIINDAVQDYEKGEELILKETTNQSTCKYTQVQLDIVEELLRLGDAYGSLESERKIAVELKQREMIEDGDEANQPEEVEVEVEPEVEEEDDDDDEDEDPDQDPDELPDDDEENPFGYDTELAEIKIPLLHNIQAKLLEWSKLRWERILRNVPEGKGKGKSPEEDGDYSYTVIRRANRGLGEYYLSKAGPVLARIEHDDEDEDDEEEEDEQSAEYLRDMAIAKELLTRAIDCLIRVERDEVEHDGSIYSLIAEAQISLANIQDYESDEQNILYNQAIIRLTKAQRLGYGNYQEQIDELRGQ